MLIILVPTIELWGLITVGGWIGAGPTILLVLATGVLGGYLAKREGLHTYRLAMIQLRNGETPGDTLIDGLLILVGGLLLLTPGFFSDVIGFLMIFPWTRGMVKLLVIKWVSKKINEGSVIWIRRK
ncbi:FxsA family protein [Hazenella coriacea]|uniref:FxsA family protein n=1 Tax=Hazenella coriacea TaxID=1179467 RepID=UPI001FB2C5B1|nr:FxsA family protein [Hazenella coriacea]